MCCHFHLLVGGGGDIAIAREIAADNASVLGHSVTTELKILILHGLLHLAGFDHESDSGEMTARESQLRRELGLPFGLIERTEARSTEEAQISPRLKSARDDKFEGAGSAQLKLRPFKANSVSARGGRRA